MEESKDDIFVFEYSDLDIHHITSPNLKSKFEKELKRRWEDKMKNGCFRYQISDLPTRCLGGDFDFVAQLNMKRATDRREPQDITAVQMPFNPQLFHFGKVPKKEVLFRLRNTSWAQSEDGRKELEGNHALIINDSPLENCHSLLCPFIDLHLPQVLNTQAIMFAVEVMLSTSSVNFRMGYNSLGANASVNHLHFHVYNLEHRLNLEWAPVHNIVRECHVLTEYPANGFVFQVTDEDEEEWQPIAVSVARLINFLLSKNIAHNVFLTHAQPFDNCNKNDDYLFTALRVYVWPRLPSFGAKKEKDMNLAVCELAGHLIIKDEDYYNTVTEKDIVTRINPQFYKFFNSIQEEVMYLFAK